MTKSRILLGLICLTAWSAAPATAWWWNNDSYTYRNYSTTTFTIRPYNAFSDMSCSLATSGSLPISLLSQSAGNSCGSCAPACQPAPCYPPCYSGWPALYYNYGSCGSCSNYPPAMYYPYAAYYPPIPQPPMPKR